MTRRVEAYRDGEWVSVGFWDLHPKERFRLFDMPKNEPVRWRLSNGELTDLTIFFSLSPPYKNKKGTWTIDCKTYDEMDEEA